VNCLAIIGVGTLLFPILRRHNESMGFGYAGSRLIESALLFVSAIGPLLLVAVGQEYAQPAAAGASQLETFGVLALEWHDYAFQMAMVALGLGGVMLGYVLYRSRLVPRAVGVLGIVGYIALLVSGLLEIAGYSFGSVLFIPGGLFEALFPLWLIVKGFNVSALTPQTATAQ
jgi:hypothetical protein